MDSLDQIKVYMFLILFTLLFLGEFLINQVTHSVLILVDSYFNLFQITTLIFILLDHQTTNAKSIRATFGWVRLSILGNLVCHCFFGALAFALVVEGLQLLVHASHEQSNLKPHLNLFAAVVSLFVQLLSCRLISRLLNKDQSNLSISNTHVQMHFVVKKKGKKLENVTISEQQANQLIQSNGNLNSKTINNNNLLENEAFNSKLNEYRLNQKKTFKYFHLLRLIRNFISGTFLIVNSVISHLLIKTQSFSFETTNNLIKLSDPIIAIISVIFICLLIYPEVKQSGLILLQTMPSYIDIDILKRKIIKNFQIVNEINELNVWCLTTNKIIATCHLKLKYCFKTNEEFTQFLKELHIFFKNEGIDLATIQPEFIDDFNEKLDFNEKIELNEKELIEINN